MAYPFSDFKYADGLTVVGISFCTAIVCEAISWVLIYRTNSYKNLRSSIDKASKKLETMKTDSNKINIKKSKTKKIDRVETSLKESSRDLSLFKFKSGGVVALVLFVVFGLLNSLFEGKVVAKLPFKPFGLVMKMSHRGLQGTTPLIVPWHFYTSCVPLASEQICRSSWVLHHQGVQALASSPCQIRRPVDRI